MMRSWIVAAGALYTLAGGCGGDVVDDANGWVAHTETDTTNGKSLNGRSLNGKSLNGRSLNGVSLSGATLSGVSLTGITLTGTKLCGTVSGTVKCATALVGATFNGVLSDGTTWPFRLDAVTQGAGTNSDVYYYSLSYDDGTGVRYPMCVDPWGATYPAIPLSGTWDYTDGTKTGGSHCTSSTQFTFACGGYALYKCANNLGYKPWVSSTMANYHETCTRTLRADYCGNGHSWTIDGQLIDVWDAIPLQLDTETAWTFEAEWNTAGAPCLSSVRVIDLTMKFGTLAACVTVKAISTCGSPSHFSTGTLIMDRYYEQMFLSSP